jgi:aminoglycoside 3-N-acetyltransferase
MSDSAVTLTQTDIAAGLREVGLQAGMRVMVHSSLSRFGQVEGGAMTVIRALQEVITPQGTLMMPSFNHFRIFTKDGAPWWDAKSSRTTNGIIPDTFWRQQGVCRSWDPSHPFAAWGKDARRYTQFHHRTLVMGEDSPLGILWRDGGYGLLLGVGYGPNTFHHVVEVVLRAPCLGYRTESLPMKLPDGRIVEGRTWTWRSEGCPITDGGRYHHFMFERNLHRQATIGNATATLFKLQDCYDVIAPLLQNGCDGFPPCSQCPIRPMKTEFNVESDWDMEKNCLKSDSPSRKY